MRDVRRIRVALAVVAVVAVVAVAVAVAVVVAESTCGVAERRGGLESEPSTCVTYDVSVLLLPLLPLLLLLLLLLPLLLLLRNRLAVSRNVAADLSRNRVQA